MNSDVTRLWHMHLGHMSENGMTELRKKGLDGQSTRKLNFYDLCVFWKQRRVKFSKGIHNTKGTLDYLHLDLWGPSRVPSKGDTNYMLTIIDDLSKRVWSFILKHKSDVFHYDREVDREADKSLHTDNGLEFGFEEFDALCRS